MTRLELLDLLIRQAHQNGFEFRQWYREELRLRWPGSKEAIAFLAEHRRYYALLFSHEFAQSFWRSGARITFQVPAQSFTRRLSTGEIGVVHRKAYTRRSARENAWLYHLREMAASGDPLRYMRRYLRVAEELDEDDSPLPDLPEPAPDDL
ncbi:MAG TPA: hypothetical protein VGC07_04360 [Granulicella sp.]